MTSCYQSSLLFITLSVYQLEGDKPKDVSLQSGQVNAGVTIFQWNDDKKSIVCEINTFLDMPN